MDAWSGMIFADIRGSFGVWAQGGNCFGVCVGRCTSPSSRPLLSRTSTMDAQKPQKACNGSAHPDSGNAPSAQTGAPSETAAEAEIKAEKKARKVSDSDRAHTL